MAQKTGAGGRPQNYDADDGRYKKSSAADYSEYRYPQYLIRTNGHEGRDKTVKLPDEQLPRSLSAHWANEEIKMPNGTVAHFSEGSKLHHKEVFAGKGTKTPIRDVERLVREYGGEAKDWQKIKAIATLELDGKTFEAEIHWYEEPENGQTRN